MAEQCNAAGQYHQYTTTLHILDPEPTDILKPENNYTTLDKNAGGCSAQMDETYASFGNTYNVKTNFIRRIYSLLCIQLALTCMMCYLFYTVDSIKNYVLHSPGLLWTSIIMTFVFLIVGLWGLRRQGTRLFCLMALE